MADVSEKLSDLLHRIVELLPWRQESDKLDAHTTVTEDLIPLLGRNAVPAGVQTSDTGTSETSETSEVSTGFPTNPAE